MSEIKNALTAKRLTKAVDGLKTGEAPAAMAEDILRKPGSRIRRLKEAKGNQPASARSPTSEK